jgi:alginate O-acetyltransferase complex protein AlgJ
MKRLRLLPVFFIGLILVMGAGLIVLPRQEFSSLEKRYLASPPALTLAGGQFSRDMEEYLGDHFPLRANWVGLDARRRLLTGIMAADSVWRLPDGALVESPLDYDATRLTRNVALLSDFAREAALPFALVAPPAAGAVSPQAGYYPYPDEAVLEGLNPEGIRMVPLFEAFKASEVPLYYRTDPHWNGQGAYRAYQLASSALGFEALPVQAFSVTESPGFFGSAYARSGLWSTPPDILELWDSGAKLSLTFDGKPETHDSLFFTRHLSEADQYPVFLDGNHGLTDIINHDRPSGRALLVLKDSYGNSLVPLLLPHFDRVTVIDLRAYRGNVLSLARENGCDQILAVYALRTLATGSNFAWLIQGDQRPGATMQ